MSYQSIRQQTHTSHGEVEKPLQAQLQGCRKMWPGAEGAQGTQTIWSLFYGFHRKEGVDHSLVSQERMVFSLVNGYAKGRWKKMEKQAKFSLTF